MYRLHITFLLRHFYALYFARLQKEASLLFYYNTMFSAIDQNSIYTFMATLFSLHIKQIKTVICQLNAFYTFSFKIFCFHDKIVVSFTTVRKYFIWHFPIEYSVLFLYIVKHYPYLYLIVNNYLIRIYV